MALELSLKFLAGNSAPQNEEPKTFRLEDEPEQLDEEDYRCAVDLFESLMAIRNLDVQRRVNITSYLSTHVHDATYALTVNGIELGAPLEKLGGFTKALEEVMDEVLRREKVETENKAPKGAKSS